MSDIKRREFITLIGGAAITSPLTASAQQRAMPLLGLLSGADPVGYAPQLEGFRLGLRDHGFVEGQTIKIEYRWAESKYDRLPALAADLVSRKVDIIITQGTPAGAAHVHGPVRFRCTRPTRSQTATVAMAQTRGSTNAADASIQNDSGLPQGLAGHFGRGSHAET